MNSLNAAQTKNTIVFISIDEAYKCFHNNALLSNIPSIKNPAGFIFLNVHDSNTTDLSINGNLKNVSSLNWQYSLPRFDRFPGLIQQIGVSLSPIFQGPESAILAQGIPSIGITYPKGDLGYEHTVKIAKSLKKVDR